VIDNNQTTWRQFGCFVAASNTFFAGCSGHATTLILFHAMGFSTIIIQLGRDRAAKGFLFG
jgi:hypothetical protein